MSNAAQRLSHSNSLQAQGFKFAITGVMQR